MAVTNARLCPSIETMFLTASETNQFTSSRFVKEIARHGGDVSSFVSAHVRGPSRPGRQSPERRAAVADGADA